MVVRPKPDDRSALSIGLDWGTRITTIGLEFALPACLGFGVDRWLDTAPWFTILGALLGLLVGTMHMIRLATSLQSLGERSAVGNEENTPRQPHSADHDRPG